MKFYEMTVFNFEDYKNVYAIGNVQPLNLKQFSKILSSKQNSLFIYTGDFMHQQTYEQYISIFERIECTLSMNNNYVLFIRGDQDESQHFKVKSQLKKDLSDLAAHSIFVPDYSVIKTNNHNILCIGGARSLVNVNSIESIDIKSRMSLKPKQSFYDKATDIDIVISHDAPINVFPVDMTTDFKHFNNFIIESYSLYDKHVKTDICKNRLTLKTVLESISKNNKIDKWIYGHYNKSNKMNFNNTEFISLAIKEILKI